MHISSNFPPTIDYFHFSYAKTKMKYLLIIVLALAFACVETRVLFGESILQGDHGLALRDNWDTSSTEEGQFDSSNHTATATDEDAWSLSIARGTKLLTGMTSSDASAAALYGLPTTAESPFDGDLTSTLREWGFNDNTPAMQQLHDPECNMNSADGHMLARAFADLGLDTNSKAKGGTNECFQLEHFGGQTILKKEDGTTPEKKEQYYEVCGTKYRVTGAELTIGVNAAGGAVFALNLASAAKSARRLWGVKPEIEQLPHIRSVSDVSWAFWNRAVAGTPGADLRDVKYFFVNMIINKETNQHVRRAMKTLVPPLDGPVGWPGHDFTMESEAGRALLGSPVGRWSGYLLMQHKRQLGGDRSIEKVRVFKSEKAGSLPYLLFYAQKAGSAGGKLG